MTQTEDTIRKNIVGDIEKRAVCMLAESLKGLVGEPMAIVKDKIFIYGGWNELYNEMKFDVVRPVYDLKKLRDLTGDYGREQWKIAVNEDATDLSFNEWAKEQMGEYEDEEDFFFKDGSFCDVFDYHEWLREVADDHVEACCGKRPETWESAGCFPPKDIEESETIVFDARLMAAFLYTKRTDK